MKMFAVSCPACSSTTYWIDDNGKPELLVQPFCQCFWNSSEWDAALEAGEELMLS